MPGLVGLRAAERPERRSHGEVAPGDTHVGSGQFGLTEFSGVPAYNPYNGITGGQRQYQAVGHEQSDQ